MSKTLTYRQVEQVLISYKNSSQGLHDSEQVQFIMHELE
jgi:hypothetical protein